MAESARAPDAAAGPGRHSSCVSVYIVHMVKCSRRRVRHHRLGEDVPLPQDEQQLDSLSDAEVLDREAADRTQFLQLSQLEPRVRGTTYREIRTPPADLEAWDRWTASGAVARARGLTLRRVEAAGSGERREDR
jgi:hypothetical protein